MIHQKTVVVIPCFNEEGRLPFEAFEQTLAVTSGYFFVFVNDGSTDQTGRRLGDRFGSHQNVQVLHLPENLGKAQAIREGVLWALKNLELERIGFLDSDLATPFDQFGRMVELLTADQLGLIVGCRVTRLGARISRNWARHYLGRVFATVVSLMLDLPVYDTQCGAKVFRKEEAQAVFKDSFVSRWFFDVELFFRIKRFYSNSDRFNRSVVEFPLGQWSNVQGSKLTLMDFIRTPLELYKIHRSYH